LSLCVYEVHFDLGMCVPSKVRLGLCICKLTLALFCVHVCKLKLAMDMHVYKPRLGFEFLYVGSHEYELSMLATHFNMVSITCDWNNRTTVEGIY
jgi:hypothetical protein